MTEVIGVRFKSEGKVYYFDPNGFDVALGDNVIIETSRGIEFGHCAESRHEVEDNLVVQPLRPVIRIATPQDEKTMEENRKKEKRAFEVCEERIAHHGLDMKLVEVEYNFEGTKILFFFTSDGRVDFRELVKDLAGVFRTRIELRQIGVRDEAKLIGGLGICGRPFCCTSFLDDFQPVSIKMAKTQSLSLNPTKISGTCGRLMCCLKYEQDAYEDLVRRMPKINAPVETPDGPATVAEVNLLRETVKVRFEGQVEKKSFKYDDEQKRCVPIAEKRATDIFSTSPLLAELSDTAPAPKAPRAPEEDRPAEEHRSSRHRNRRKKPKGDAAAPKQEHTERAPRPPKPQGDRPPRPEGEKPQGEKKNRRRRKPKPQGDAAAAPRQEQTPRPPRPPKPQGDKPQRPPRPEGEKPQGEHRPRSNKYRGRAGNRPPKPQGEPPKNE